VDVYIKKIITVKDTLPLIPLKILPFALNTLIPLFLPLSEAVLEVLFHSEAVLEVLLRFHGYFDFGEEPEVAWCQIR